ncbi:hypothetical protein BDZ94DRAFT_914742 [Collybia nuda]|uniref:Oxidase ustYa n=1 Tax=Collybia nuda TaxID=64659 RepID=A0A9P5YD83_9AGAR|nr:hypothetical protein BDZ94DRAFT_914742 [Collybia nuda]
MTPNSSSRLILWSIFTLIILLGTVALSYGNQSKYSQRKPYTYRGSDYPQTWEIPPLDTVKLSMENSVHYDIDTPLGIAEWNSTLPKSGGMLYLGPDRRPFSISMFHQLRCLDIIRAEVVQQAKLKESGQKNRSASILAVHCMNYMRQMVMCRANTRLESVRRSAGPHVTVPYVTHTCRDWSSVYEAAEKNWEEYLTTM